MEDRTLELIRQFKEEKDEIILNSLFNELVSLNQGLIKSVEDLFKNSGVPREDIAQEAIIAFLKAIEGYKEDNETKFSTYAYRVIKQNINRYVKNIRKEIRIPEYTANILNKIMDSEKALEEALKRKPTNEEVAKYMDMDLDRFIRYKEYALTFVIDVEKSSNHKDMLLVDIVDKMTKTPEEELINDELNDDVVKYFDLLSDIEKDILSRCFGLGGNPPQSNREIGEIYKISAEAVRQKRNIALRKIKNAIINGEN